MRIGNVEIHGYAALAPMAGVADNAMRELCREYGASYTVGELVSAMGISMQDKKSRVLLSCNDSERPYGAQIFGSDPKVMARAAAAAMEYRPDFIDINMGCPAPKVAGNGGGSALMRNPELAGAVVRAVCSAVSVPVTVKMRAGWDADSINATCIALACEAEGAAAVTVHGRTRSQMYAPPVNLDIIKQVKSAVKIPVIGNGDIDSPEAAKKMYEYTGCDFVMVGRAAMGNPWIFSRINSYFENGIDTGEIAIEEKLRVMRRHIGLMMKYKDPHNAILESRKHTSWYMKGIRCAAAVRRMCGSINSMDDIDRICEYVLSNQ